MKFGFVLVLLSLLPFNLLAQGHDFNWLIGYASYANETQPIFGVQQISFHSGKPQLIYHGSQMDFRRAAISISDFEGELLFYSNAMDIRNGWNDNLLENGTGLNPGFIQEHFTFNGRSEGSTIAESIIAIPTSQENKWGIFHSAVNDDFLHDRLLYTEIDLSSINGVVLNKNYPLINDTLCQGNISAVKQC